MWHSPPARRHQFSAGIVSLFLELVLRAPASQRAAATILKLLGSGMDWTGVRWPCANSGRLWLMRLGLYALTCPKPQGDDWLWMVDQTVPLGPWKCLVIVGVRLSVWRSLERPLCHQDLSLLNVTPLQSATQEAVAEQLRRTCSQTGRPLAVLSDEGTELKGGMALFQERQRSSRQSEAEPEPPRKSPAPLHLFDIKHKSATILKKILAATDHWDRFVRGLTRTKQQVTLTSLAFLNPPRLRNKARFMNLIHVVNWGCRALKFVKAPRDFPDEPLDRDKREAKLGWLREFEAPLRRWRRLLAIIHAVEKEVRREGDHRRLRCRLKPLLRPLLQDAVSRRLARELLDFVHRQGRQFARGQHVIGHTEVLESLLGKYKQTQGRYNSGGMTASLLNLGAAVLKPTPAATRTALERIPVNMVTHWVREHLGHTILSKQKLAFR